MSQIAKVRLFHNADKTKLVHEGDEAAFLYANTGDEIPDTACELYGLVDGDLADAAEPAPKLTAAEKKAAKAAADKAEADAKAATEKDGQLNNDENKGDGTGDAAAPDGDAAKAGEQGENKGAAQSENKAVDPAADKAAK